MLEWLAHWHNWPFEVSLLVGLGLVGLTLLGFSKDLDHGIDLDGDGIPDLSIHLPFFAVLGVGRVPLSVLIEVLLVSFGLVGLTTNAVAHDLLASWGAWVFPGSLALALVGSFVTTRAVAGAIASFAPAGVATARTPGEFVGSTGVAASLVTHLIGQIQVAAGEPTAPDALLNAQVDPDWPHDIARGTEVYVAGYDAQTHLYAVRPLPTD